MAIGLPLKFYYLSDFMHFRCQVPCWLWNFAPLLVLTKIGLSVKIRCVNKSECNLRSKLWKWVCMEGVLLGGGGGGVGHMHAAPCVSL